MEKNEIEQGYLISLYKVFKLAFYLTKENFNTNTIIIYLKSFLFNWFYYYIPILYGEIIEGINSKSDRSVIEVIILWYVTALFGEYFMQRFFWYIEESSGYTVRKMEIDTFKKIINKDMAFFEKESSSYIIEKMNNGVNIVSLFSPNSFIQIIRSMVSILISLWCILSTNIYIGIVILIFFSIYFYLSCSNNSDILSYEDERDILDKQSDCLFSDSLINIRLIKAFSREKKLIEIMKMITDKKIKIDYKNQQNNQSANNVIFKGFPKIFILWYCGNQIIKGNMSLGLISVLQLNADKLFSEFRFLSNFLKFYIKIHIRLNNF